MAIFLCLFLLLFVIFSSPQPLSAQTAADWPMAGYNPARSSWGTEEITGSLSPAWYKIFNAFILKRTQIIGANNMVFVATARGLYALDAATGAEEWIYATELPLGDTPAYANGIVYIGGMDKKMHAVDANTGEKKWTFNGEAGFQSSPVVVNNTAYVGSRDSYFYALDANTGSLKWRYKTGGPITYGAAYKDGVIYLASNDSYAYALNENGSLKWKSAKLPGAGFHSWWPVVYQNYVIYSGSTNWRPGVTPAGTLQFMNGIEREDIYPQSAGITRGTFVGPTVSGQTWANGAPVLDTNRGNQGTNSIGGYFESKPWRRTYYILDRTTGQEYTMDTDGDGKKEYAPILWVGSHSGNRYPPIVSPSGILFQSNDYRSDDWIPGGNISGWKFGTQYISIPNSTWNAVDEPQAYVGSGNFIYWTRCCDRVGAGFGIVDITKRWNYFSYSLSTIIPDYNEKYYNPDSGDAGSPYIVFGGPNGVYGYHGDSNPLIPYKGKLYTHQGNAVIAFAPSGAKTKMPYGTIKSGTVANVIPAKETLKAKLEDEVKKIIAVGHLRPGYLSSGKVDGSAQICGDALQDYFHHPADTIFTLIKTLPHLSATTTSSLKSYIQKEFNDYPPYQYNHIGWKDGAQREVFTLPPEVESDRVNFGPQTSNTSSKFTAWKFNPFAFYSLWLYAKEFGNAKQIFDTAKTKTSLMDGFNNVPANLVLTEYAHVHNAYIAGYIGYLELEKLAGYSQSSPVKSKLDSLLSLRASSFSKDSPWADQGVGDTKNYCRAFNVSRNFLYLVPELANYLRANALSKVQAAVNEYSFIAPYWFVSQAEVEYSEGGAIRNLYDIQAMFQAKALILKEGYPELAKYIDVPAFERGDLFYIDNLVSALEASGTGPTSGPSPTNIPNLPKPGDANADGKVDGLDYVIWLNHYNQQATGAGSGDFDGNGKVDGLDYVIWLGNYGK